MDAQDFLLRHGEKIGIVLVAGIGAWAVYAALSDAEIRPAKTNAQEIHNKIAQISDLRGKQEPPLLKQAPDHLGAMRARFGTQLPVKPVVANLTVHPDQGVVVEKLAGFFYLYELRAPTVSVEDKIGALEVTVAPAVSIDHGDDRVSDELVAKWSREEHGSKVENHAEIAGYVLEQALGTGAPETLSWKQLAVIPIEKADQPYAIRDVQAFETYNFRAKAILKATGLSGNAASPGNEILVFRGSYPNKPVDWAKFGPQSAQFAQPQAGNLLPVAGNEQLFVSDDSALFQIQASADLKIVLKRVSAGNGGAAGGAAAAGEDAADAGAGGGAPEAGVPEAQFLITRFVRPPGGGPGAWVEPQVFKAKVGDTIGGEAKVGPLGKQVLVDLRTPFVLERIEPGQQRVLYWELAFKPRAGGAKGKDIDVDKKATTADSVVLKNKRNNAELRLLKLATYNRTTRPGLYLFPDGAAGQVKEDEEFKKSPQAFKQPSLEPAKPIPHAPDTGPLKDLFDSGNSFAKTDTTYYELPDGRLVYWESTNGHPEALYKLGATPKADPKEKDDAKAGEAGAGVPEPAADPKAGLAAGATPPAGAVPKPPTAK